MFRDNKKNMKQTKAIIRDIKNLFKQGEEDYYKLVRVDNFYSNNYIICQSNGWCCFGSEKIRTSISSG